MWLTEPEASGDHEQEPPTMTLAQRLAQAKQPARPAPTTPTPVWLRRPQLAKELAR